MMTMFFLLCFRAHAPVTRRGAFAVPWAHGHMAKHDLKYILKNGIRQDLRPYFLRVARGGSPANTEPGAQIGFRHGC